MTYKDHFVVEVKSDGKILRVRDDIVHLPFGSEYSLLLKNLNSKRANIKVSIDGQDVLDCHSLILDANSETELMGFLQGTIAKNRFRFIQKTKQIQDHRGDRLDDGIIRVEFAFEKPRKQITWLNEYPYDSFRSPIHYNYFSSVCNSSQVGSANERELTYSSTNGLNAQMRSAVDSGKTTVESLGLDAPKADEGITVKGNECDQRFNYGCIGELEAPQVIIIQLRGATQTGSEVEKPLTVKDKLTCSSCGTKSKSSFKFCPNCGTFLD